MQFAVLSFFYAAKYGYTKTLIRLSNISQRELHFFAKSFIYL